MMNMNPLVRLGLIGTAVLASGLALAQPASAPGMAPGPGPAASTPQATPRYGNGFTPGWKIMTPEEHAAVAAAMGQMKSRGECVTYMDANYKQMVERARQKGLPEVGNSRRDLCNVLPK
jgi:hypothetical protein